MERKGLFERLWEYHETDYYPYHMPGHKRRCLGRLPEELLGIDITEIDGFDNLHQAEGILAELQQKANELYRAEETFYLINGSTGGILSAVSAALPEGGHLLMARGCHRSAYHAAYLRKLKTTYLCPRCVEGFDFCEAADVGEIERMLDAHLDIGAALIVSPTYEGRIADVRAIAEAVHRRGIPLIVDEAHGSHLGFARGFAEGSCTCGADLVIHSVHKTLPAPTQTALIHVNGDRIDRELLKRFLHIYQSSSPSYILMAGIADAMDILERQGRERLERFRVMYERMLARLQGCSRLRFVSEEDIRLGRQDIGKLVISAERAGLSGKRLYDILRDRYRLQCEMASGSSCLAMFTLADEREAFERMEQALLELDGELTETDRATTDRGTGTETDRATGAEAERAAGAATDGTTDRATSAEAERATGAATDRAAGAATDGTTDRATGAEADRTTGAATGRKRSQAADFSGLAQPVAVLSLADAWDGPWEMTNLSDSVGRIAADFVCLYPPGIPILAPGEMVTEDLYHRLLDHKMRGLDLQGIVSRDGVDCLKVLADKKAGRP